MLRWIFYNLFLIISIICLFVLNSRADDPWFLAERPSIIIPFEESIGIGGDGSEYLEGDLLVRRMLAGQVMAVTPWESLPDIVDVSNWLLAPSLIYGTTDYGDPPKEITGWWQYLGVEYEPFLSGVVTISATDVTFVTATITNFYVSNLYIDNTLFATPTPIHVYQHFQITDATGSGTISADNSNDTMDWQFGTGFQKTTNDGADVITIDLDGSVIQSTPTPAATPTPANTPTPQSTPTPASTPTLVNTATPQPTAAPTRILEASGFISIIQSATNAIFEVDGQFTGRYTEIVAATTVQFVTITHSMGTENVNVNLLVDSSGEFILGRFYVPDVTHVVLDLGAGGYAQNLRCNVWGSGAVTASDPSDHGALSGLEDDDHPQYMLHTEYSTPTPATLTGLGYASPTPENTATPANTPTLVNTATPQPTTNPFDDPFDSSTGSTGSNTEYGMSVPHGLNTRELLSAVRMTAAPYSNVMTRAEAVTLYSVIHKFVDDVIPDAGTYEPYVRKADYSTTYGDGDTSDNIVHNIGGEVLWQIFQNSGTYVQTMTQGRKINSNTLQLISSDNISTDSYLCNVKEADGSFTVTGATDAIVPFTHSEDSRNLFVQVYNISTGIYTMADVKFISEDRFDIDFGTTPADGVWKVVYAGPGEGVELGNTFLFTDLSNNNLIPANRTFGNNTLDIIGDRIYNDNGIAVYINKNGGSQYLTINDLDTNTTIWSGRDNAQYWDSAGGTYIWRINGSNYLTFNGMDMTFGWMDLSNIDSMTANNYAFATPKAAGNLYTDGNDVLVATYTPTATFTPTFTPPSLIGLGYASPTPASTATPANTPTPQPTFNHVQPTLVNTATPQPTYAYTPPTPQNTPTPKPNATPQPTYAYTPPTPQNTPTPPTLSGLGYASPTPKPNATLVPTATPANTPTIVPYSSPTPQPTFALDSVFSTNGLLRRTGANTYTIVAYDSSLWAVTSWNAAFNWGNHASAGYFKRDGSLTATGNFDMDSHNISNIPKLNFDIQSDNTNLTSAGDLCIVEP